MLPDLISHLWQKRPTEKVQLFVLPPDDAAPEAAPAARAPRAATDDREHDWNGVRLFENCGRHGRGTGDDELARQPNKFLRGGLDVIGFATPAIFDFKVATVYPPQVFKSLLQGREFGPTSWVACRKPHYNTYTPYPLALLRARHPSVAMHSRRPMWIAM